jgi:deoxyribonuclease-4
LDPPDPDVLSQLGESLRSLHVPLFFHTVYLVNLASPEAGLRRRSAVAVAHGLVTGALAGAAGVVTHVGSHRGEGFTRVLPWIKEALRTAAGAAARDLSALEPAGAESLPWLLLETGAGSGATVGHSLEELEMLMAPSATSAGARAVHPGEIALGLCVDTAHVFAAGYPVHQAAGLEAFVAETHRRGLLDRVRLIHLNDSKTPFACNRDRHADPGQGELGYAGLSRVVKHPAFTHLPFVLETPGHDGRGPGAAEIALVKSMRTSVPDRQGAPFPGGIDRGAQE